MSMLLTRMECNENTGPTIRPADGLMWIYFGNVDDKRIKVGKTSNPERRFAQHKSGKLGQSIPFEPLCWLRGQASDESYIKRYFADCAVQGESEVFHPTEKLLDYIRWLREQYYVAIPDLSHQELEAVCVVDSSHWLPNESNRKPMPCGVLPGVYGAFCLPPRNSTADDYYTNQIVIDAARKVLGSIDLDPASHPMANKVVNAKRFFTRRDNGLSQRWSGNVWCNPPFGGWKDWVPKIVREWTRGNVEAMCVLSAMRTLTAQYFSPLLQESCAVCIMHGRIRFWGRLAGDSPDDGHAVFYFGNDTAKFDAAFSELGTTFVRR